MRIAEDHWLSERFGHPVFRVAAGEKGGDDLRRHRSGRSRATYYAKVETSAVAAAKDLIGAGMYPVDVVVTLERDGASDVPPGSIGVEDAAPRDEEAVLRIAGSCFTHSRFHLDPAVPRAVADSIKREWIANYFRRVRGDRLLVARDGDRPVGFLAALRDGASAVIDLIGVDRNHQGRGGGSSLVAQFIREYAGCRLRVGTQAANIPSLRLYARHGFVPARTEYVLHMHVGA